MTRRTAFALLSLTVATACGARTDPSAGIDAGSTPSPSGGNGGDGGGMSPLGGNGGGGSDTGSSTEPSCALTIDPTAIVQSLVTEGERIYYVATQGRVMSADAQTGATTLLAQFRAQPVNIAIALALDADWLYFSFEEGPGVQALWRIAKTGGVPEQVAKGRVDNVYVDSTGIYWTQFLTPDAKHEVFRRQPDGTTLSLGVIDETYDELNGLFRGKAGLLVPTGSALLAFDPDGGGPTTISGIAHIAYPFERDAALFFNIEGGTPHGMFRTALDGSMPQQLYDGSFARVITDGQHWVFTSPFSDDHTLLAASYPDGDASFLYKSPTFTPPRAVALTPTRLVLGAAYWELEVGIQSLCRASLGL
ncbi:MAG: hypothetical protein R3B70_24600 [Polyangiaceae bacterium]